MLHNTNVTGSMLVSPDNQPERLTYVWRVLQQLAAKTEAIPMLKRCDNSVFIDLISLSNVDSLKVVSRKTTLTFTTELNKEL